MRWLRSAALLLTCSGAWYSPLPPPPQSSDREPIPRSAVVRANKTAPQPRAEAPPPLPVGDAGPSAVVEKKKKKKLPKTGPVAHVEDADKRVYARPAGSTTQITSIIPDAAVTADVDEFDGDEEEEDDDMEEAIAAPLAAPVVTLTEFKRRVDLVLREFFLEGEGALTGARRRSRG